MGASTGLTDPALVATNFLRRPLLAQPACYWPKAPAPGPGPRRWRTDFESCRDASRRPDRRDMSGCRRPLRSADLWDRPLQRRRCRSTAGRLGRWPWHADARGSHYARAGGASTPSAGGRPVPVSRVAVNSTGGETSSVADLAALLRPRALALSVGPGDTYQSDRIGLTGVGCDVAPAATLMFHASAVRVGLATTGGCGWLNAMTMLVAGRFRSSADMLPWARRLSPKLPKLFDACPRNPLTAGSI